MVVWAVEIDDALAEAGQRGEGGGRTIDELSIDAVGGDRPSDDEGCGLAWVEAGRREDLVHGPVTAGDIEDGLDGAEVGSRANGTPVGALPDGELDGAEDDGLACARFAGEDIEALAKFKGEIRHQGEVADAKR